MLGKSNVKEDEDLIKKRVYSIYAKNTPTVRAQAAMDRGVANIQGALSNRLVKPIKDQVQNTANLADTSFGGAGTRQALNTVSNAVSTGRVRQKNFFKERDLNATDFSGQSKSDPVSYYGDPTSEATDKFKGTSGFDTHKQQGPILGPYAPQIKPQIEPIKIVRSAQGLQVAQEPQLTRDQKLMTNSRLQIGNYDTQFDIDTPLANRQAFSANTAAPAPTPAHMRPRTQVISAESAPTTIAPPKTMGDMLRYNRESKAQRQAAEIENARTKTGIEAFAAQKLAEHTNRSDINAARATDISGTHYARADATDALQADIAGKHYANYDTTAANLANETARSNKARQALEESKTPSEIALREAQTKGVAEQALSTEQEREAAIPRNNLEQALITEQNKLAFVPGTSPNAYNALKGNVPGPMTDAEKAQMSQKESEIFIKFMSGFPLARQAEAEEKYKRYRTIFGNDPNKMQALMLNNPELEDEDEAYKQQLFQ